MKRDFEMQNVELATHDTNEQPASSPDTLFGVCYSIGQDFGFNPFYLRIALIALAVFSLPASFATYLALGLAVGLSRLFFPSQQAEASEPRAQLREVPSPVVENERQPELITA